MRIAIFTDLHMNYVGNTPYTSLKEKEIQKIGALDGIILCGDNAKFVEDFYNHYALFEVLDTFNCPVGFICGNHDLWGWSLDSSQRLLEMYSELADEFNFVHLEDKNLTIGDEVISGTYGHYDYSLGIERGYISRTNFIMKQAIIGNRRHSWEDRLFMDWDGSSDEDVCNVLMDAFEKRAAGSTITISHGVPNMNMSGYPSCVLQDFLGAFSGTKRSEEVIRAVNPKYHFCGHTHAIAEDIIGKTKVYNLGSDYKSLRYALIENDKATFCEKFF